MVGWSGAGTWTRCFTTMTAPPTAAAARFTSAGCWRGAPFRTSGSCRASSTAPRSEFYDPAIDAWHILWSDPLSQYYARQIGRAHGRDIVQEGTDDAGAAIRWSFTEITPNSFHWRGERSLDRGATWQPQAEFFARRVTD